MKLRKKIAFGLFAFSVAAQGHVSVSPQQSKPGATEHYLVRVPTEGQFLRSRLILRFQSELQSVT
jgi:uncharacterized protein YcnI